MAFIGVVTSTFKRTINHRLSIPSSIKSFILHQALHLFHRQNVLLHLPVRLPRSSDEHRDRSDRPRDRSHRPACPSKTCVTSQQQGSIGPCHCSSTEKGPSNQAPSHQAQGAQSTSEDRPEEEVEASQGRQGVSINIPFATGSTKPC